MSTPNSGTPPPNVSEALGDTSKLAFLDDIPLDVDPTAGKAPAAESPAEGSAQTGEATEAESATGSDTGNADEAALLAPDLPQEPAAAAAPAPAAVDSNGIVSAKKGIRDYSAIKPEDVDAFKQMSDKAYEKAINWYKNHKAAEEIEAKYSKELNELRDYRFYQHPEAYRLSPEYSEAATQYRTQTAIINHWERALEQLEAGEPINDITLDDKGNVQVIPNDIPATPQLKARVSVMLQQAMAKRGAVENNLETLSTKYQNRLKQFDTQFDTAVNQLVSPQLLEDAKFKSLYNNYLTKVVPPELQNVPVYKQNAKMAAFIQLAAQQIQVLQKRLQANSIKASAVREQGPGDGVPATGKADWKDRPVADVLAEFEALRAR